MPEESVLADFLQRHSYGGGRSRKKKNREAPENINPEICKGCGWCCRRCGCYFSPEDFPEISYEYLKKRIEEGYISLEFVLKERTYLDYDTLILRVRNQGAPVVDLGLKRTPCVLLTEKGCALSEKDRPSGGVFLIPMETFNPKTGRKEKACYSKYDIEECALEWRPYQDILLQLLKYFQEHNVPQFVVQ